MNSKFITKLLLFNNSEMEFNWELMLRINSMDIQFACDFNSE